MMTRWVAGRQAGLFHSCNLQLQLPCNFLPPCSGGGEYERKAQKEPFCLLTSRGKFLAERWSNFFVIQEYGEKYLGKDKESDWMSSGAYNEPLPGDISSELYGDWLWDENFKFCLIFTHFSRFSPFSGYIWWNNTLSSLENFSLNSILFFLFLMSHPDNGGFLKIAQKRDSISKKTSFCIMVINTDHQESWFLSVGHPLCALR